MNRRRFVVASSAVLASPYVPIPTDVMGQTSFPSGAVEAVFVRAVDGEKIRVDIGEEEEEVRFIGVDAPEPKIDDNTTECYAVESTNFLRDLLTDQTVFLEGDQEDRDSKDRLWRYVWANVNGVPTMLNEFVLAQGMAIGQEEETNVKYKMELIAAEQAALEASMGLWGACESGHQSIPRHGSADDPGTNGETLFADGMSVNIYEPFVTYDINFSTPKGGHKFLIISTYFENVGGDTKGYSAGRFEAKDMDTDADYKETFVFLDQPLGSGDLSPLSYVSGQVCLEIQETTTNVRVKYQVNALGGESLYWLLPSV